MEEHGAEVEYLKNQSVFFFFFFSLLLLSIVQITNRVQVSDMRSVEPKTRLHRDKRKVKRFSQNGSLSSQFGSTWLVAHSHCVDGLATVAMGMCGPAQALKAEWPDGDVGVIISSRLLMGPHPPGAGRAVRPLRGASLPVDAATVLNPAEAPRWDSLVQGSGLTTGGRLPDSHKPGPDGVGWGGKGPGKASWTVAQCGDCLSAQALGHTATPPWARAPALGFQRDVTGGGGAGFPLSIAGCLLYQLLQSPPPPPQTAFSPHSLRPQMPIQQLFCFSHEARLPLTLCHSHHCCLTFGRRRGRLCCYTAPICPMSFHAVDHDAAAWHSGRRKDFGRYTGPSSTPPLCTLPVQHMHKLMHTI